MAELYRKSALERISSPEQLDKVVKITSPMSWLVLLAITLIIVVTVIWSIVGSLPVTVTAQGIVASPVSTNAVYLQESGTVVAVLVQAGDELHFNDPILTYKKGSGEVKTLFSDQTGIVSEVMVENGTTVIQGNEALRLSPSVSGEQVIVCYISVNDAKKLERGMNAQIYLSAEDSQTYGHMVARVVNIDSYAASSTGMSYVLGSGNNMVESFQANGAVVSVACELYPDASTKSGYYWSNSKGAQLDVTNGSLTSVKIITEEVAPITKLFSKLKEIWGD